MKRRAHKLQQTRKANHANFYSACNDLLSNDLLNKNQVNNKNNFETKLTKFQNFCFWSYLGGLILADGHVQMIKRKIKSKSIKSNLKFKKPRNYVTSVYASLSISSCKSNINHLLKLGFRVGQPFNINFYRNSQGLTLTWNHKTSLNFIAKRLSLIFVNTKFNKFKTKRLFELTKLKFNFKNNKKTKIKINELISFCAGFTEGDGQVSIECRRQKRKQRLNHYVSASLKWSQKEKNVIIAMINDLSFFNKNFKDFSIYKSNDLRFGHKANKAWLNYNNKIYINDYYVFGFAIMDVIYGFKQLYNFNALGRLSANNKNNLANWSFSRYALISFLVLLRIRCFNSENSSLIRLINQLNKSLVCTESLTKAMLLSNPLKFAKLLFHLKHANKKELISFVKNLTKINDLSLVNKQNFENFENLSYTNFSNNDLSLKLNNLLNLGLNMQILNFNEFAGKQFSFYPKNFVINKRLPNRLKPLKPYNKHWLSNADDSLTLILKTFKTLKI